MTASTKPTAALLTLLLAAACGETPANPIVGADTGAQADASTSVDAGQTPADSGAEDARPAEDAGQAADAAPQPDTGLADAGAPDSGAADAGSAPDSGAPSLLPRLVVSSAQGLSIWDRAAQLTTVRPPDVTLAAGGGPADGVGPLAAGSDRIFAGNTGPSGGVAVFERAATLGRTAAPLQTLPGLSVTRMGVVADRLYAMGNVAACAGVSCTGLRVIDGAGAFGAAASWRANLYHMWGQLPSFAVVGPNARVFAGQISGAGLLAYSGTATLTGDQTHSFQLDPGAYWAVAAEGDRLFAGGDRTAGQSGVSIWTGALGAAGTTAPVAVLQSGLGPRLPPGQTFIADIAVRDDVLAVPLRDQNSVLIYLQASQIRADRAPDAVLSSAVLNAPTRVLFGPGGRLFVIDDDGVLVFDPGPVGWSLVAELTPGLSPPRDLALVE